MTPSPQSTFDDLNPQRPSETFVSSHPLLLLLVSFTCSLPTFLDPSCSSRPVHAGAPPVASSSSTTTPFHPSFRPYPLPSSSSLFLLKGLALNDKGCTFKGSSQTLHFPAIHIPSDLTLAIPLRRGSA